MNVRGCKVWGKQRSKLVNMSKHWQATFFLSSSMALSAPPKPQRLACTTGYLPMADVHLVLPGLALSKALKAVQGWGPATWPSWAARFVLSSRLDSENQRSGARLLQGNQITSNHFNQKLLFNLVCNFFLLPTIMRIAVELRYPGHSTMQLRNAKGRALDFMPSLPCCGSTFVFRKLFHAWWKDSVKSLSLAWFYCLSWGGLQSWGPWTWGLLLDF